MPARRRWRCCLARCSSGLGFAAVTLPLYLPASALPGLDFATAYAAIAWLCWLPDLL
jgi:hypothetical protein